MRAPLFFKRVKDSCYHASVETTLFGYSRLRVLEPMCALARCPSTDATIWRRSCGSLSVCCPCHLFVGEN